MLCFQGLHVFLTNLEELSFLTVFAFPKASRMGFACSSCFSSSPWRRGHSIRAKTPTALYHDSTLDISQAGATLNHAFSCSAADLSLANTKHKLCAITHSSYWKKKKIQAAYSQELPQGMLSLPNQPHTHTHKQILSPAHSNTHSRSTASPLKHKPL